MIEGLKPFSAYRPSGIPAIGQIPLHWETRKLRHWGEIRGGMTPAMNEPAFWSAGTIPWVTPKDMKRPEIDDSIDHVSSEALARTSLRLIPPDSVLLVTRGMILARRVPIARTNAPVTINQDMKAIVLKDRLSSKFLALALENGQEQFATLIDEAGHGTKRLPTERWREIVLPVPTEGEQRAIARFLDHADRRICKLIAAKRKLIALLEEQKRAIIDRVVTRGLDPKVRLKESGVPWLGMVPEHWWVGRSKRIFRQTNELARPEDLQLSATQAYGVIPQAQFEEIVGRRVVKIFMHLERRRHVEIDDFVISMRSFQGGLERAWSSGAIRSSYVVLRGVAGTVPDYFGYLFKSQAYIGALQITAGFIRDGQDLNFGNFCDVDLPLPPIAEQRAIAEHIASSTGAMASSQSRFEREIALLREYRTRLISDVVTGKLDVREAAARLPDVDTTDFADVDEAALEGEGDESETLEDTEGTS